MPALPPIEISHSLGRAEARRRIATRVDDLPRHIPGGIAQVSHSWAAEDRMALQVAALGQSVEAQLDIEDRVVRVQLVVPPMLSLMAGPITAAVQAQGHDFLLPDRHRD